MYGEDAVGKLTSGRFFRALALLKKKGYLKDTL
jgi:hypothetical protein